MKPFYISHDSHSGLCFPSLDSLASLTREKFAYLQWINGLNPKFVALSKALKTKIDF